MENDTSTTDERIEYVELLNPDAYDQETTSEMIEMDDDAPVQEADGNGIMHEIITIAQAEDVSMLENYEEIQYVEAEVEIGENTLITHENQTIFIHEGRKYIIPNDQLTNGDHTIILDEEDGHLIAQDDEEQQEMFYTTSTDLEADETRQFAVLKDGKLHLTNLEEENNETDEIQEKLRHLESSLTNYVDEEAEDEEEEEEDGEESDKLEEITGKNLITGQTISLSGILEKMRRKSNGNDLLKQPRNTQPVPQQQPQDYVLVPPVTRRVVVGRTHDGKRLVGRILQIQKKIQPNELKINQSSQNTFSIAMPTQKRVKQRKKEPQQVQQQPQQQEPQHQQPLQQQQLQLRYMSRSVLDENVARTLAGLMDLESINKKLKGRRLVVRHIQRRSREGKIITGSKKIAYYCGRLKRQSLADNWTFVQETPAKPPSENENGIDLPENTNDDNSDKINLRLNDEGRLIPSEDPKNDEFNDEDDEEEDETLTLYLTETQDEYGKKKTKVTIPEFAQKAGKPSETSEDFTCKFCGKKFQSSGSLRRHSTVHDHSLRPLQCLTCLGRFTDESSLKKHMILHTGVRPHKCNLCEKSFAHRGDLNFHLRTHDPVKRYECSVCKKQFNRHSNMLRHAEIHRPAAVTAPAAVVETSASAKAPIVIAMSNEECEENSGESKTAPFTCDQCGIQYNYSSSLTRHIVNVHLKQTDE